MDVQFLRLLAPYLRKAGYSFLEVSPNCFQVQCLSDSSKSQEHVSEIFALADSISQVPSTEAIAKAKQWPDIYGFCIEKRLHNTQIARQLFILYLRLEVPPKVSIQEELRVQGFKKTDIELYDSIAEYHLRFYKLCQKNWMSLKNFSVELNYRSPAEIIIDRINQDFVAELQKRQQGYYEQKPTQLAQGWLLNSEIAVPNHLEHFQRMEALGFIQHDPSNKILEYLCRIGAKHPQIRKDIEELDKVAEHLSISWHEVLNCRSKSGKRYKREIWKYQERYEEVQNQILVRKPYFNDDSNLGE